MKEVNIVECNAYDYLETNPDNCIIEYPISKTDKVRIVEYAPKLFRNIRK